jgi:hypothetical protein
MEKLRGKLFLSVLAAGLMLGGIAVAQSAPESGGNMGSQATADQNSEPVELVDPGKIYNQNPMTWVGKKVTLKNVMIQDTNDSGNFWVGSDSHHRLLVVKPQDNPNLKAMRFHKGDVVVVTGTVQPASKYAAQETSAEKGSMKDASNSSGVFLMANDISISSSTQHK